MRGVPRCQNAPACLFKNPVPLSGSSEPSWQGYREVVGIDQGGIAGRRGPFGKLPFLKNRDPAWKTVVTLYGH